MEVTFSEGGTYKFACYRLTYEESKSPDRIAKIKADLASKGKDGYSIAITCGNVKKCAVGKYPKSEKPGGAGQAAVCACAHSRYFTGGSPSGLRV